MLPLGVTAPASEITHLWAALADGLHYQRLQLSYSDWTGLMDVDGPVIGLDSGATAGTVMAAPAMHLHDAVWHLLKAAKISGYADLCMPLQQPGDRIGPLASAASDLANDFLADLPVSETIARAVRVVSGVAAWWVGFFAVVRDTGVHHRTLVQDLPPFPVTRLMDAARVVATGLTSRVTEQYLRTRPPDLPAARIAYSRVVVRSVQLEPGMHDLIEELAELRLVDLVTTSMAWRGQFSKYAGGTGAGQVE